MSLLRDIQSDLASDGGDVTTVLRKCKILAARLGSDELAQWVERELNGYPKSQPVPEYRRLSIQHFASFMSFAYTVPQSPVPLEIVPEKYREAFTRIDFHEGIAKAVSFTRSKTSAIVQKPDLISAVQGKMYPDMECQGVWGIIPITEFEQLVSAVKSRVLDLSLKIEAENPDAGEAPPNSNPVPMEKLQPIVNNVFHGPVGNVAQNSEHFSQTASIRIQPQDLAKLVTELATHLDELNLDARQRQRAEAQIATLNAELAGDPDPAIVMQAGRTLRNITEGAIGSLLATAAQPGVWHWIHQMLSRLGAT